MKTEFSCPYIGSPELWAIFWSVYWITRLWVAVKSVHWITQMMSTDFFYPYIGSLKLWMVSLSVFCIIGIDVISLVMCWIIVNEDLLNFSRPSLQECEDCWYVLDLEECEQFEYAQKHKIYDHLRHRRRYIIRNGVWLQLVIAWPFGDYWCKRFVDIDYHFINTES